MIPPQETDLGFLSHRGYCRKSESPRTARGMQPFFVDFALGTIPNEPSKRSFNRIGHGLRRRMGVDEVGDLGDEEKLGDHNLGVDGKGER